MKVDLESVVSRLPALVYVYSVNHDTGESGFHFASKHVEEIFGYTQQEVLDDPKLLVNAILEEEAEAYAAAVMESMANLTPFDRLGRMRRKDGRIIYVHYKSTPRLVQEKKEDGSIMKLTVWDGIVMDVTKQVSNEENNRTRLEEILDKSLQPVFEVDTQGNISEWNNAMATITEYSREEAMGQPVVGFMVDEERGNFCTFFSHACKVVARARSETQQQWDCVFVSKDARRLVHLHAKCTPSKDSNLTEKGLLCLCQDITKVKEVEKQKDDALKLVDAERGLTEWLSHEVRNPLSVAMEAAVALQEGDKVPTEDNMSYSDLICESIRYIVDLLTNMLDLNKCLDGKIPLFPSTCRIREDVLVPTCKIMGVCNNRVELVLSPGPELEATVDKLRLRQVLTNLVANALKYTKEGWVRVELEEMHGKKNNTMKITVADSGCGINPADYEVLFSKWERLGSQINGAGIGLCLSRALVKSMGGDLSVDKDYTSGFRDNKGAQFVVELPLSSMLTDAATSKMPAFESLSAAVLASNREKRPMEQNDPCNKCSNGPQEKKKPCYHHGGANDSGLKEETHIRGKFNILIIDDDRMGRRLLTRRFSRLFPDASITEVASGEDGLKEAEKTTFDIITVDHFMAVDEMNGAETIKALRERNMDSCIVGISGNSKREEHLEAGAQDFFQKPIPKDDVLMERLLTKISPPSGWKVLCVDDVDINVRFMCRRLYRVAAPYFISTDEAKKRWQVTSRSSGEEAIELLGKEWFDLVVVDQHLGEGVTGTAVAAFVREHAVNRDAVVVLNTGSMIRRITDPDQVPYNCLWPKPLPSTEQMRLELCRELLASKANKQLRVAVAETQRVNGTKI